MSDTSVFLESSGNRTYVACPICFSRKIQPVLSAKDYTVSSEKFEVWQCDNCKGRFTQNIPIEEKIGAYYQSEDYISHPDSNRG